MTRAQNPVCSN